MNNRPPTLKDVAELAGVSKMAVSAVVNDSKSTVGVSEATRQRILKALEELQYQPNAIARSLRLNRTGSIGIYSSVGFISMNDPYMREVFSGLSEGIAANKKDLLLYCGFYSSHGSSVVDRVLNNKIDAVVLLPSSRDGRLIEAIKENRLPCVALTESISGLKSVTAADEEGSKELARYLLSKGHRHILYRRSPHVTYSESTRFEAFKFIIEETGAKMTAHRAIEHRDSLTAAEDALLRDRNSADRVTVVVGWRDYSAVRALSYCRINGINVPGDLAIAGFDGIESAAIPPGTVLTTVDAHWHKIARTGIDIVERLLKGEKDIPDKTIVPADLRIGNTT
jgi:DNA-binding LacI/PurR family transcriptional regulator